MCDVDDDVHNCILCNPPKKPNPSDSGPPVKVKKEGDDEEKSEEVHLPDYPKMIQQMRLRKLNS